MKPDFFLRIGVHAEVEPYALRRGVHDGIIVNANLLEATSGATATMLANVYRRLEAPYFIDPYTHVFSLEPRFLKSERKSTGKVELKATFADLATRYGEPFAGAAGNRRLAPADFADDATVRAAAGAVIGYQYGRIEEAIGADERAGDLLAGWPGRPRFVLAPYFPTGSTGEPDWMGVNARLAEAAVEPATEMGYKGPGVVLCLDRRVLRDEGTLERAIGLYSKVHASGYFLWVSNLREEQASLAELRGLVALVRALAETGRPVCNLHAGFFSMALSTVGLTAYSHGVGYGEHRDVEPATGYGLPPERYYLPLLHSRSRQAEVEDVVKRFGIATVEQFREEICNCPLCQVVVKDSVDQLGSFFEMGPAKYDKKGRARRYSSSESIQRCRYHFLLNRRNERFWLGGADIGEVRRALDRDADRMGAARVNGDLWKHLRDWSTALDEERSDVAPDQAAD
jgi:hypothetical protein